MKSTFIASCISAIAMSASLDTPLNTVLEDFIDDTESLNDMQIA
jgi:hypothetical protein